MAKHNSPGYKRGKINILVFTNRGSIRSLVFNPLWLIIPLVALTCLTSSLVFSLTKVGQHYLSSQSLKHEIKSVKTALYEAEVQKGFLFGKVYKPHSTNDRVLGH